MAKVRKKQEKPQSLLEVAEYINKVFEPGTSFLASEKMSIKIPRFSSGSLLLDKALGGGYPKGRIIEIYGGESSGKTTLSLMATREVQKAGGNVAFIDAEHALDLEYAKKLGVDEKKLVITQPNYGEQALDILEQYIGTELFDLIVVDSVAALVPKAELEGEAGEFQMGLQARMMSQAMRKITPKLQKTNTTVIFINQTRSKIGVMFGSPTTTTGGNALKFYASQRLETARIKAIKNGDDVVGHILQVKVVKNKVSTPYQKAQLPLIYGKGVYEIAEIVQLALDNGILEKSGASYKFEGNHIARGLFNLYDILDDNPEILEKIKENLTQNPI